MKKTPINDKEDAEPFEILSSSLNYNCHKNLSFNLQIWKFSGRVSL